MVSSGEKSYKYVIFYIDDDYEIKPLRVILPEMVAYVKNCDGETKLMNILIKDDDLLKKCNIYNI